MSKVSGAGFVSNISNVFNETSRSGFPLARGQDEFVILFYFLLTCSRRETRKLMKETARFHSGRNREYSTNVFLRRKLNRLDERNQGVCSELCLFFIPSVERSSFAFIFICMLMFFWYENTRDPI